MYWCPKNTEAAWGRALPIVLRDLGGAACRQLSAGATNAAIGKHRSGAAQRRGQAAYVAVAFDAPSDVLVLGLCHDACSDAAVTGIHLRPLVSTGGRMLNHRKLVTVCLPNAGA